MTASNTLNEEFYFNSGADSVDGVIKVGITVASLALTSEIPFHLI